MGELHLQSYTVNGQQTAKNNNYYTNNFDDVKKATADTKDISGEKVIFEISDKDASKRDLQARDVLGKYMGKSGYNIVMGSSLWQAFVKANGDDFNETSKVTRNGEEYSVFTFDRSKSDGKISMPTLQRNPQTGEQFYELNGKAYTLDGNLSINNQACIDREIEKKQKELDTKIKSAFSNLG